MKKIFPIIFLTVIALFVLGVAGYWYVMGKQKPAQQPAPSLLSEQQNLNGNVNSASPEEVAKEDNKPLIMVNPKEGMPNRVYVIYPAESNVPQVAIDVSSDLSEKIRAPQLIGEKIYFFDERDNLVKWLDFNGGIHALQFTTPKDKTYYGNFIVSPDDKKIAWVETGIQYDASIKDQKSTSKILSSDIDGKNKHQLLEDTFEGERYFLLMKWSKTGDDIYFSEQRGGVGGYIMFWGYMGLKKINVTTSEVVDLLNSDGTSDSHYYIVDDISPDEQYISYFTSVNEPPKLLIKNINTGEDLSIAVSSNKGFQCGGNAFFSPDNKHVVYNIAHCNPDDEYFRTIVIDVDGKNQKVIAEDPFSVKQWASNDKIVLAGSDGYFVANIDGTGFSRIKTTRQF